MRGECAARGAVSGDGPLPARTLLPYSAAWPSTAPLSLRPCSCDNGAMHAHQRLIVDLPCSIAIVCAISALRRRVGQQPSRLSPQPCYLAVRPRLVVGGLSEELKSMLGRPPSGVPGQNSNSLPSQSVHGSERNVALPLSSHSTTAHSRRPQSTTLSSPTPSARHLPATLPAPVALDSADNLCPPLSLPVHRPPSLDGRAGRSVHRSAVFYSSASASINRPRIVVCASNPRPSPDKAVRCLAYQLRSVRRGWRPRPRQQHCAPVNRTCRC